MAFPGVVYESELDLLIDEILKSMPVNDSESYYSNVNSYSYNNVNPSCGSDNKKALITDSYYDNGNVNNQPSSFYDYLYKEAVNGLEHAFNSSEQAFNSSEQAFYSSEQAFNSSEQAVTSSEQAVTSSEQAVTSSEQAVTSSKQALSSFLVVPCKEVMAENEREVMFEDALQVLNEFTGFNGDFANQNSCPKAVLPDVKPSDGGIAKEVCSNDQVYDFNNVGNMEVIVPTELENLNVDMEVQLDDLIAYLYNEGKESNPKNEVK